MIRSILQKNVIWHITVFVSSARCSYTVSAPTPSPHGPGPLCPDGSRESINRRNNKYDYIVSGAELIRGTTFGGGGGGRGEKRRGLTDWHLPRMAASQSADRPP
jgi:hypothetical protein